MRDELLGETDTVRGGLEVDAVVLPAYRGAPNKEYEHAWDDQPDRMSQARSR